MTIYGKTWWGKKWLETFTGIDKSNRLPRGRTYANTGRAHDIKIQGSFIKAKVNGSRPRPYKVEIILPSFSDAERNTIRNIISNSPSILSALINKRLPESLLKILHKHQIQLFPANWNEIEAECSCPDWALPCKHIAAVIYLICAEIDKNPFIIFDIHECNLLSLIDDFGDKKLENAKKILQIEDIFSSCNNQDQTFDQAMLDSINLSKIPDLLTSIQNILRDNPVFYDKNFSEILYSAYKHLQKYPCGKTLNFSSIKHKFLGKSLAIEQQKKTQELSAEEIFLAKWDYPDKWTSLTLVVNNRHQLISVVGSTTGLFLDSADIILRLVGCLQEIPNAILHKLNPELRFMQILYQFAVKLMEKSALLPQILQNKTGEILIRWIPALFNSEVKQIYDQLSSTCPKELLKHKDILLTPQEQVKGAISLILSVLMRNNFPAALDRHLQNEIFQLFFTETPCKFLEFGRREIPAAINQWLSSLYLSDREHKLYLMIKDQNEKFILELAIALHAQAPLMTLTEAIKSANRDVRFNILSDIFLITEYIPSLEQSIDTGVGIIFNLDDFTPLFLGIIPVLKALGIGVILPKSLENILRPELNLSLNSRNKIDNDRKSFLNLNNLLQFNWQIAIGDKKITIDEFKKLLASSRGIIKFIDQYVLFDEKELQALLKQLEKLPKDLSNADLLQGALAGELLGAQVNIDEQLKTLFSKFEEYNHIDVPKNLIADLRPYQYKGFNWLVQNIDTGFGSILADDMGLGKTLQVIATILHLKNLGYLDDGPVLIVAPTSLLSNWQKEVKRFAPDLNLIIYHGQNRELTTQTYDILLTSYGLARRDKKELSKIKWFLFVIDEAQNIKNPNTQQTKTIKSIQARYKIAMSGTPVENRLLEYWSIFDFTNTSYLGHLKQFKDRYASPIEKELDKDCLERFKKITAPFILRRVKSDKNIIKDLPDKIENNHYCSLTSEQTALYQEVVNMSLQNIEDSEGIERSGLIFKLINALKQICNHPSQFGKKKIASIEQSGKMQMLEEILLKIGDTAEKSLIFTQYTQMGDIIAELLGEKLKTTISFLHGGLSIKARDEMVQEFQNSPASRILIVSLKAGGTGLNLTAANHVIHYDLWWNPAVEAQATDRAYRIGQTKNVMVHRLLSTGTFEERIDEMIQSKKQLADIIVSNEESWITKLSTEKLKDLVRLRHEGVR